MKRPTYKIIKDISFITQFGFSIISPLLLMIWVTIFLRDNFGFPDFIIMFGVFIGLGAGFASAVKFYRYAVGEAEQSEREENL